MQIGVDWTTIKNFIQTRNLSIQCIQTADTYYIFAIDNHAELCSQIAITDPPSADQTDFETNFLPSANATVPSNVRTQFEQVSYLLQMSNISSLNMAPGDSATISIKIPGIFSGVNPPCDGRYIDAGEGWFYPGADGDRVTAITVTDNDNLLGAGAGTVLGTYHDAQVDADNQGWVLHTVYPTEISTLGWYGFIPAGMYMNITVKRSATASGNGNFYCNLKWGMRTK